MAHREHVTRRTGHIVTLIALLALLAGGCSEAGLAPTEFRGRVIDQDTGQPIAGAIVVGKYMGSRGPEGASSCNRVESAVSSQDGWFTLPLDSQAGPPLLEAYHRNYKWGKSVQKAWRGGDGNMSHWQVTVYQWDAENKKGTILRTEPTIYHSQAEALEASRENKDVYLKRSNEARSDRLQELDRLVGHGICGGGPTSTDGAVPYVKAILAEQVELGAAPGEIGRSQGVLVSAEVYAKAKRGAQ